MRESGLPVSLPDGARLGLLVVQAKQRQRAAELVLGERIMPIRQSPE